MERKIHVVHARRDFETFGNAHVDFEASVPNRLNSVLDKAMEHRGCGLGIELEASFGDLRRSVHGEWWSAHSLPKGGARD